MAGVGTAEQRTQGFLQYYKFIGNEKLFQILQLYQYFNLQLIKSYSDQKVVYFVIFKYWFAKRDCSNKCWRINVQTNVDRRGARPPPSSTSGGGEGGWVVGPRSPAREAERKRAHQLPSLTSNVFSCILKYEAAFWEWEPLLTLFPSKTDHQLPFQISCVNMKCYLA